MRAGVRLQAPESGPDATASTRERERVGFRSGDTVFDRYRLERPLDRRQRVWLASLLVSPAGHGPVTIKLGDAGTLGDEHAALLACAHPNVVPVIAFHENRGAAGLILDYVGGGDLVSLAGAAPRYWLGAVCGLIAALGHTHERGFVHRDIKARNVRLDDADRARLIDFGSAVHAGAPWRRGGTTAAAIDPERGPGPVSPADDVYALLALLHELVFGAPPGARPRPSGSLAQGGESIARIVLAGLTAPPARRPSLETLADSLKFLQHQCGIAP